MGEQAIVARDTTTPVQTPIAIPKKRQTVALALAAVFLLALGGGAIWALYPQTAIGVTCVDPQQEDALVSDQHAVPQRHCLTKPTAVEYNRLNFPRLSSTA